MEKTVKIPFQGKMVDGVELDFKTKIEEWNEYQISDGTILRIKLVTTNIVRLSGEYDQEGNPVYVAKSANVVVVSPPGKLMKGTDN